MPINADLYQDKIEYKKYCAREECELCRVGSFDELVERIRSGRAANGSCAHWPPERLSAFQLMVQAGEVMPEVPSLEAPRPAAPGLIELNSPGPRAMTLVTGNSEFTQAVMLAVLSLTKSPVRLLSVDSKGHTVDMAMVFQELSAPKIAAAIADAGIDGGDERVRLILPGLAGSIAPGLADLLGRGVETGPVCAAELPLYLGEAWKPWNYKDG